MSKIYINDGWLFAENFKEEYITGKSDSDMHSIRIPHSTRILPFNYFSEDEYQTVSAYVRTISAPAEWESKRILVTFEGAAHYAEVFLNGEKIGEHYSGYTAFTLELTNKLKLGEDNVLTVKLDSRESLNIPPFGNVIDYMTFGGIYRDVYLEIKESCFISDVFAKPEATGKLVCEVTLSGSIPEGARIIQSAAPISDEKAEETVLIDTAATRERFPLHCFIDDVKLWDINSPNLYLLKTKLYANSELIDSHEVNIGFRRMEFKADGFFLNGRRVQIRGLNRHQSYPYVGYAMPESMQREDARILRSLGVNSVRTSHYPQSHYFIDECDRLGLLVFTEIPGWQHIGDGAWKEQAVKNVEEMILQYRNHPSIMIWGVRINESRDDHELYTRTNELARLLDPTRQTGGVRNIKKSELLEDVYTFNEFRHDGKHPGCYPKSKVTSDMNKPYIITENNGHMFPTKSFDCEDHRIEHALRHARVLNDVAAEPDICGSFSWCFFDYNTHKDFGSGDRICYHGVCDMFRNEKLASAVYKAQSDVETFLEVGSSMDIGEHPACIRGNVWVFTNADKVRMYKNDRFIKEYAPKNSYFPDMVRSPILIDDYVGDVFESELGFSHKKAESLREAMNYIAIHGYGDITPKFALLALKCLVLYRMSVDEIVDLYTKYVGDWGGRSTVYRFDAIKDGKVMKSVTKTPMSKVKLEVTPSHTDLHESSSYDVAAFRIRALDENGNPLPYCNEPVTVRLDGDIELIGNSAIPLRGGMAGAYVKTKGKLGKATVTFSSSICEDITIDLNII